MQEVVYNSGMHIDNESALSSLVIFYDKVLLPTTSDRGVAVVLRQDEKNPSIYIAHTTFFNEGVPPGVDKRIEWEEKYHELFADGVLERLPPPQFDTQLRLEDLLGSQLTLSVSMSQQTLTHPRRRAE